MVENNIDVKIGLTSNNLALFIQKASKYKADVFVEKNELRANAKSLLGLLSLQIINGDNVKLVADGEDECQALQELGEYLQH